MSRRRARGEGPPSIPGPTGDPAWDELPIRADQKRPQNLSLFADEEPAPELEKPEAPPAVEVPAESRWGPEGAAPVHDEGPREPWAQADLDASWASDEPASASAGALPTEAEASTWGSPRVVDRLIAYLADGVVHVAVVAFSVLAMVAMGLRPVPGVWPGYVGFVLCFSFLYTTVPLAFWGQTPGMALRGLRSRDGGNRPLTFGQTALRWVGWVLTTALGGLPGLLAVGGRSLADRLSHTTTQGLTELA